MITDTFCSQVLKVFPYPITITTVQFAVGTILVLFMWTSNLYRRPKISGAQESLDNITLFSIITIMSFFLLTPFTLFMEGVKVTPAYLQSAGLNVRQLYIRSLLAALCFHAYQQLCIVVHCFSMLSTSSCLGLTIDRILGFSIDDFGLLVRKWRIK
ncbi:hypothetical protein TEA_018802 [Camellia sinensis var. sinensis]|uniref:Sugar phosphate transporter domain-containing protein n=1 Tax=Camellia sinensis var. sinensis TaxID=542762 RepID=A0A4S4D994_CAMSN|nr:hypothetical protein TEA_018802 [Camellia sinensis var. sinensis]